MQNKPDVYSHQLATVILVTWLQAQKSTLIDSTVERLATHEDTRLELRGMMSAFLDGLTAAVADDNPEKLQALLADWVLQRPLSLDEDTVSLLPVLGIIKQSLWARLRDTSISGDSMLVLMTRLEAIFGQAGEYLVKLEVASLLDRISHGLVQRAQTVQSSDAAQRPPDFLSVVAHELKTPLTVIEGYVDMLELALSGSTSPQIELMLRGIDSGLLRLRGLIEEMIGISAIEMGLLHLERQPVWLRQLLAIAVADVGPAVAQRRLILEIKQDTIPARPIVADPERLLEAFQNILENAIKYTPDQGRIVIFGTLLNGFIDITVEDTGIGIAPDDLDRIFEKYAALGDVTRHSSSKVKFKGGGPGLGLVIAKGIVEAHGGTIWAESPGYDEKRFPGSRFHIMLPIQEAFPADKRRRSMGEGEKVPENLGQIVELPKETLSLIQSSSKEHLPPETYHDYRDRVQNMRETILDNRLAKGIRQVEAEQPVTDQVVKVMSIRLSAPWMHWSKNHSEKGDIWH